MELKPQITCERALSSLGNHLWVEIDLIHNTVIGYRFSAEDGSLSDLCSSLECAQDCQRSFEEWLNTPTPEIVF